jgi:hypothetical protein
MAITVPTPGAVITAAWGEAVARFEARKAKQEKP